MDSKVEIVESHGDNRGKLIILLNKNDLSKKSKTFGEVFYITFSKKGIVRANHYHKKWREWFVVVSGKIKVDLIDIKSSEKFSVVLDSKNKQLKRLEVGPYIAHSFTSLAKNSVLLNYSDQPWKAKDVIPYDFSAKKSAKK